ncbi:protein RESPONSE TO ABA AND SALT 1-like [Coffea arabica]|uniref:Protein RESPONSE TO ABA AND SALT 1-like n=1 Tax=Coffea arabica TaxID=13443 RepID=A0A6P6WXZ2_COFAR
MAQAFPAFYEGWMMNHQNLLEKLLSFSSLDALADDKNDKCQDLLAEVLAHYQQYYEEKTRAVNKNVFLMLSPPWLSSYERALLWISDFIPTTLFPLIDNSLGEDLADEQRERIQVIRAETRRLEKEVEQAMAAVQESIAAPPIFDLLRRHERTVDGEISELDAAMDKFKENMMRVIENADALRGSTVTKLVEILCPVQAIKFLAGAFQFTLRVRRWGSQRDAQSSRITRDVHP